MDAFGDRILVVEVQGVGRMLRAWKRRGEVFRAAARRSPSKEGKPTLWLNADAEVLLFSPFLHPCEKKAPKVGKGMRDLPIDAWLRALDQGAPDALDLRLHEVKWHVIDGGKDRPRLRGIASNDMARRAATTTRAERLEAIEAIRAAYDKVRFVRGRF